MSFLLLFKADSSLFDPAEVEQVLRSDPHFRDIQLSTPVGDLIACAYYDGDDWVLVNLDGERRSIYFSATYGAASHAVLAIQRALDEPMRLYDDSYTFDLTFSDIETVEELEAAMKNASTS